MQKKRRTAKVKQAGQREGGEGEAGRYYYLDIGIKKTTRKPSIVLVIPVVAHKVNQATFYC